VGFLLKLIPGGKTARLLLLGGLVVAGLWAYHWVNSFVNRINTASFETRTVNLALTQSADERYTALDVSNIWPGANIYTGLDVGNSGDATLRYSMASTPSGDSGLDTDLQVSIAAVQDGSCNAAAFASGMLLEREKGGLASAVIAGRPLAAGATDYLCFHLRLPVSVPRRIVDRDAQATLNFTAQQ
jgi:hypothetical protein